MGNGTTVFKTRRNKQTGETTLFAAVRPGVTYQNTGSLRLMQAEHDVLARLVDAHRQEVAGKGAPNETGE
jgi:hypothetical protein